MRLICLEALAENLSGNRIQMESRIYKQLLAIQKMQAVLFWYF